MCTTRHLQVSLGFAQNHYQNQLSRGCLMWVFLNFSEQFFDKTSYFYIIYVWSLQSYTLWRQSSFSMIYDQKGKITNILNSGPALTTRLSKNFTTIHLINTLEDYVTNFQVNWQKLFKCLRQRFFDTSR